LILMLTEISSNFNDVRKKMLSDKVLYINIVYTYTRCICWLDLRQSYSERRVR
jgi:hypothetical protein